MSFYEGRRALPDDNDVREPAVTPSPASRGAVAPLPDPQAWLQYRKARPAERLLPITTRWLDGLPADMRPGELATQYPRVANLVALHWSDDSTCPAYFDALLVDHRGSRQGFPDAVQRDLLKLRDRWYSGKVT